MLDQPSSLQGGDDRLALDEELELFRSTPSPWAEAGDGLEPRPPASIPTRPSGTTARATQIKGRPIADSTRSAVGGSESCTSFLPLLPSSSPRQLRGGFRDASPLVSAYQALVEQSNAATTSFEQNCERRRLHEAALRMGIAQLSSDRVWQQQRAIRFSTLKNEVDIFQQCLDPFVFEMRSTREHQVRSSVYRHFVRMQGVQEMGIPIYSLGNYLEEESDRILTARMPQKLYRRIRRHDAAHYIDTELIPRPALSSKRRAAAIAQSSPSSPSPRS